MWKGTVSSNFTLNGVDYEVQTVCHPTLDMISAKVVDEARSGINLRFPYPTGQHSDDACDWKANDKHATEVVRQDAQCAVGKEKPICWRKKGTITFWNLKRIRWLSLVVLLPNFLRKRPMRL